LDNKKNEERNRESNRKNLEQLRQEEERKKSTREFMIRHKETRDTFAKQNPGFPDELRFQYHTIGEIESFKENEKQQNNKLEENENLEGHHFTPEEQEEIFAEMRKMNKLKRENITEYNKLKNIKPR
jgi:hypothetical protein